MKTPMLIKISGFMRQGMNQQGANPCLFGNDECALNGILQHSDTHVLTLPTGIDS